VYHFFDTKSSALLVHNELAVQMTFHNTKILSQNKTKYLSFVMETLDVFCEEGAEFLCIV